MRHKKHAPFTMYVSGFVFSVMLTLTAYLAVVHEWFIGWTLLIVIAILAVLQLIVQVVFFLHLNEEKKPRWHLRAMLFTVTTVLIVVIGSIWIMHNLDYNMMPDEQEQYMLDQYDEGGF